MDKRRKERIRRIEKRLSRKSLPRVLMTVIVLLSAFAAFLTSFTLLWFGVWRMSVRYPIAVIVAYLVFLILLAAWLWLQRRTLDLDLELLDIVPRDPGPSHEHSSYAESSDIGTSASGSNAVGDSSSAAVTSKESALSTGGFDFEFEELLLVILVIVAIVGGLVASLYVIYIAPALLAEILVDGAVFAGLYRRVKHIQQRHWLRAAIRRTVVPALLAALCFGTAGYLMQRIAPVSHTIGEFWQSLNR